MLGAQDYYTHDNDEFLSGSRAELVRRPTPGTLGHDYWRDEQPLAREAVDGQHGERLIEKEARAVIASHGQLVAQARAASASGLPASSGESGESSATREPPMFLYVASQAPHTHFVGAPPEAYARADNAMGSEAGGAAIGGGEGGALFASGRRDVAALVVCLDDLVGGVLDALRAASLWEHTLLVFASDNGPEPAQTAQLPQSGPSLVGGGGGTAFPLRGRKRTVWEGGIKSLAFLRAPRSLLPAAHQSRGLGGLRYYHGLISFVDFAPTLLAAASASDSASAVAASTTTDDDTASADGISFWEALQRGITASESPSPTLHHNSNNNNRHHRHHGHHGEGGSAVGRSEALLQYDQVLNCGALRRGRHKLVWNGDCGNDRQLFGSWDDADPAAAIAEGQGDETTGEDEWLLFDLHADPSERVDLSESQPELLTSMRDTLMRHGANTADALAFVTPGDDAASPALHGGAWVSWLGE